MIKNAQYWIQHLQLQAHPEGGYYIETYKSQKYPIKDENSQSSKIRSCASLIYFLLDNNEFSAFHKLKNDEVWLYHAGGSVNVYIIDNAGQLKIEKFGSDMANGEKLQVLIPANSWFAAELVKKNSYSLMSCMVSPGFEWSDFELGEKMKLFSLFPRYKVLFEKFCKD